MHQHQQSATLATDITFCVSIFFLLCCSNVTRGERALDCCLKVSHTKIPAHVVRGYQRQVGGNGCVIGAVIFVTRKGHNLCAPPGPPWVKTLTSNLDKERKRCQDGTSKQRKRCKTLRF